MIRSLTFAVAASGLFLSVGCKKNSAGNDSAMKPGIESLLPAVATDLGFATRIPMDADVFVSGYHADEMLVSLVTEFSPEIAAEKQDKLRETISNVGDELFVSVGPGAGAKLEMIGTTYRELSAAWAGFSVGTMLDAVAQKDSEPDFTDLANRLSGDLLEKWLNVVEKDSQLQIPSVVMGWKPSPDKLEECLDAVLKGLDEKVASGAKLVKFESSGVDLTGFQVEGREIFAGFIAEAREKMTGNLSGEEVLKRLSPERIERLMVALENVRFTIAAGLSEGRVLIYFGDGQDGFRLAKTPAESLAASEDLRWTGEFADKRITGTVYLSESMVRAALPWLDSSDYWRSISREIKSPVKEERLLRDLLTTLADTDHELALRDASAWSAVVFEDDGWRFESRGGWPDPSLDYETPLRMTGAALALNPAIRAHWVQNRSRKDLAWKQNETLGLLVDTVIGELQASANPMLAMIPEGTVSRLTDEVRDLNRAYRDEFRAGVGDEVAMVVDFQGEIPAFPGISEETVKNGKAPRFVIARPVIDRSRLDAAGTSFAKSWRSLTEWGTELSGNNLPLILPQSLESGGLVTWYPPMPFIGGDFVPGVSLNDRVWMLGTSRSMAGDFSKYLEAQAPGEEKGMIIEIDFAPVREWFADIYDRNKESAELLTDEVPERMKKLKEESLERVKANADRVKGLSYRKWMADGKPRTRLHLRFNPR